jgi:23S rRNA (adenine2503-C2)-methyltransferase
MKLWNEIRRIDDEAENVAKFVFTKKDAVVESVLYKYPTYQERTVICCSTQSGCPVGCRFCGTGDYFVRNLTTDEIISQIEHSIDETNLDASEIQKLQIMFMSMGEPLLNLKALIPALYTLYEKYPHAKLLISTSAPSISHQQWNLLKKASVDIPTIGLQFSVHESTNEARDKLVPFKAKMTLEDIYEYGCSWWLEVDDGRKPFFNYCAHDANSSNEDADRILTLYNPAVFNATVSVICERNEGMPATNDHQRQLAVDFAAKLVDRGFDVRVFDPAGQDTIGGGCGQLWFVQQWMEDNPQLAKPSVGNGKEQVHVPHAHV